MKVSKSLAVFFGLAISCVSGCINIAGDWRFEETARVTSLDGVVDAVLVEGNAGATTSYSYTLFIVPRGTKFEEKSLLFEYDRAAFSADHQIDLQLVWSKPKFLEIRYEKARIFKFSNFWNSQEVQDFKYIVELRLMPSSESSLSERDK